MTKKFLINLILIGCASIPSKYRSPNSGENIGANTSIIDLIIPYSRSMNAAELEQFIAATIESGFPEPKNYKMDLPQKFSVLEKSSPIRKKIESFQMKVFGKKDVFKIYIGDDFTGEARIDVPSKSIFFNSDLIDSIVKKENESPGVIYFLAAHEFAHYFYALMLEANNGVSFNGNLSQQLGYMPDTVNPFRSTSEILRISMQQFGRQSRGHAEVDLIGAQMLIKFGLKKESILNAQKNLLDINANCINYPFTIANPDICYPMETTHLNEVISFVDKEDVNSFQKIYYFLGPLEARIRARALDASIE